VLAVSSDSRNQLVTSGVDHIKFWTLSGRSLACTLSSFGKLNGVQQVCFALLRAWRHVRSLSSRWRSSTVG
jgi:hypothetical protein